MYYEARSRALSNGQQCHLAAFTRSGLIGTNTDEKATAKFLRRYEDNGKTIQTIHAEVALVLKMRQAPPKINVVRFLKNGTVTMAKPCIHCQNFLRHRGVKLVRYTNWDGEWEEMKL